MKDGTYNAVITYTKISIEDGFLDCWLGLDYGGSSQGFGGYALYLPKSYLHHEVKSPVGHWLYRCMEVAEITDWFRMVGKTVRVKIENGIVVSIGHIIKDIWFAPKEELTR